MTSRTRGRRHTDDSRFTNLPAKGRKPPTDSGFTNLPANGATPAMEDWRRYEPPTRRPRKGDAVHEHEYRGRNGVVLAVIREPLVADVKKLQYVFTVRWDPAPAGTGRHQWATVTSHAWDLGTVRPGPGPRPRNLARVRR